MFTTKVSEILERIEKINPAKYAATRNFIDGSVTHLSPYISRGVISTKYIFQNIIKRGFAPLKFQKFVQELAWRDYWQQVWIAKGDLINDDLKQPQEQVENYEMPATIIDADTEIIAIDDAITNFYKTGYLHNHVRMYIASLACNIGKSHWRVPAQWMYYNLLDADWASNALSWQWVAATNSHKKYYANQQNVNRYCHIKQHDTFLDKEYSELYKADVPEALKKIRMPELITVLPKNEKIIINNEEPTCIYNFYNLDPFWKEEIKANRILLIEPSVFKKYPVARKTIDFIISLSKNIKDIQVYSGEFSDFKKEYGVKNIFFKEHPLNKHYTGTEESRDWMFNVKGYYPSFFAYWKKCEKEIKETY